MSGSISSGVKASVAAAGRMAAANQVQRMMIQQRSFLTSTQLPRVADKIATLPHQVQAPDLCHSNSTRFLRQAYPGWSRVTYPFPTSTKELDGYLKKSMVFIRGLGTADPSTQYTSGHAVVVVMRIETMYLIFDGDNTVCNSAMEKLRSLAQKSGKAIHDLTPAEINSCDGLAGLYRLEPVDAFVAGLKREFARDADFIPEEVSECAGMVESGGCLLL